jgi:hypothetical protein
VSGPPMNNVLAGAMIGMFASILLCVSAFSLCMLCKFT